MDILFFLILLPVKVILGITRLVSFVDEVCVYFWRPSNGGDREELHSTGQPQSTTSADQACR
jgi:hypothetical protein